MLQNWRLRKRDTGDPKLIKNSGNDLRETNFLNTLLECKVTQHDTIYLELKLINQNTREYPKGG